MEENIINTSTNTYVSASETTIKLSELCFLAYWSLMLFAKAVGWYDGQTIYKIVLVISIAFWAVKMALTKYSLLEYGIILGLLGLSGAIYLVSGEKGIVICMMTMLGVKNIDIKRILKVGIVVWGGTFVAKFLYNLLFLQNVQTTIQPKAIIGRVNRYYMGYSHPNVLHISFFMLVALIICFWGKKITFKKALALFALNILVFMYSFSFTGAAVTALLIVLAYFFRTSEMKTFYKVVASAVFPIVILFSIVFPIVVEGKALEIADKVFNRRIVYAKSYLQPHLMTFLGNNLAEITDRYNTMDNSFVFSLVIYGVPMFLVICGLYIFTIHKMIKQNMNAELITVLCLIIGGVTEPYFLNTSFKNISLLYVGMFLYLELKRCGFRELSPIASLDKDICLDSFIENIKTFYQRITASKAIGIIEIVILVIVMLLSVVLTVLNESGKFKIIVSRDFSFVIDGVRGALTCALILTLCFRKAVKKLPVAGIFQKDKE